MDNIVKVVNCKAENNRKPDSVNYYQYKQTFYYGWFIKFLANKLDEFDEIDMSMTIEEFTNKMLDK